jgi:type IX secretion system PorP/SprF family membrane protein
MKQHNYSFLLLILFALPAYFSSAQQEPTNVLFWNNYLHTNPAMTGAVYKHQANISWKDYALKDPLAASIPYQQVISANYSAKLEKINSGIGGSYRYDSQSSQLFQTGLISYAYHLPIKSLFLSFGISGGIKTLNYQYPDATGLPVSDHKYKPAFTSDFGIALRHEKWNVGVSLTQWNGATLRTKDSMQYPFKLAAHLWLFADYRFDLGENWSLTPRVQVVSDKISIYAQLQLIAAWKQNLWFGAGIEPSRIISGSNFRVCPMIGYDIKGRFRLGYSAVILTRNNYPTLYRNITHEAVFGFMFK